MILRLSLLVGCTLLFFNTQAEKKRLNHPPLSLHPSISGTYGELRTNHFHSGMDFRTQGTIGHDVYAVEDAYVSRIKVMAASYGHVLYLTHPNGYSSVYAHLDQFDPEIEAYVREEQYKRKTYEIELFPKSDRFRFRKGEKIATSGNSGYSYGPHLHFEIRNTQQVPLNPMAYPFKVRDDVLPEIRHIAAYPLGDNARVNGQREKAVFPVEGNDGSYYLNDTLSVSGEVGFGIEVYDFLTDSRNQCGVYRIQLFIDEQEIYAHTIEAIPFHQTRFINALLDYQEWIQNKIKIQQSFVRGYNQLSIYDVLENDGVFDFHEERDYSLRYVAADYHGNSAEFSCVLRFSNQHLAHQPEMDSVNDQGEVHTERFLFAQANTYEDSLLFLQTPAFSFYQDFDFSYRVALEQNASQYRSPVIALGEAGIPLHKPVYFEIKMGDIQHHPKAEYFVLASIDQKGELRSVGGELSPRGISARIRNFGLYTIVFDTLAPSITPLNISDNKNMENEDAIRLKVQDELSGISDYQGYIDDEWVLFAYDMKNDMLIYQFDQNRIQKGKHHTLELYVTDKKNNMEAYFTRFYY